MKRILYTTLVLFSLLISSKLSAQAFNFTITPNLVCYNASIPQYTFAAAQTASAAGATNYAYSISSPTNCSNASFNYVPATNSAAITITVTCCGVYTVNHFAFNGATLIQAVLATLEVVCPTAGSITVSSPTICNGSQVQLTGSGANTYTWIAQTGTNTPVNLGTANPLVTTPTAQTTYSLAGTTSQSCPINPSPKTVYIQKATVTLSPASSTICPGAPVTFNATYSVSNGGLYTTGTTTTALSIKNPTGGVISTGASTTIPASAGNYSAFLTYTGAAGSCTAVASAVVNTISTISVTAAVSNPSVCPGSAAILSASLPAGSSTAASSYTWTQSVGTPPTFTGNPVTKNPTVTTVYTVNVNYYGCTGSGTVQVGMSTLTVNLSSSSPSTCPGKAFTLTATGGLTYTFTAQYPFPPTFSTISTNTSVSTVTTSISNIQYPATITVNGLANGCTGSSSLVIGKMTLNTQIVPNSVSVCPNTSVFLHNNNGCGTTWTVTSLTYSTTLTGTNCTPSGTLGFNVGSAAFLPITFTTSADSAGCKGSANITIYQRFLSPVLLSSSITNSICPGTSLTLTSSGGAGTNYTFTAPFTVPPATNNIIPNTTASTNTVAVTIPTTTPFAYTFTVDADSSNCTGTGNITIGQLALNPNLSLSSASICPGGTVDLTSSLGSGTSYTFVADYTTTPTSSVILTTTNSPGVANATVPVNTSASPFPHVFTVNVDSAGCVGTSTAQVGLLGLTSNLSLSAYANPTSTVPSLSVCPGSNYSLVAINTSTAVSGNSNFVFQVPPISNTVVPSSSSTNSPQSATLSVNAGTSFPQTYTVLLNNSGCVGVQTITINQMFLQNFSISANPAQVCAGRPSTITAYLSSTVIPSTAGINYSFGVVSPSTALGAGPSPTVVFSPTTQAVIVATADSAGCTLPLAPGFVTTTINILPGLVITPASTSPSVCAGLSTTLSVTGPTANNVTYTWAPSGATNFGTLTPSASSPFDIAFANPTTTAVYTVSASDTLGCVGSTVITIGIDPTVLSVSVSVSNNTICPNTPASNATLSATWSISPATYSWIPSTGLSTTSGNTTIAQPVANTVYSVLTDNGYGCMGLGATTIFVNQQPTITALASVGFTVCPGYNTTLTALGANSYVWVGLTFSAGIAQQSISVGPGIYTVTGSNGGACTGTTVIPVYLGNPLQIQVNVNPATYTTCIVNNSPKYSKPVVLTASGANSYVWFPYNPIHMTYSLGASTTVRPPATTQYTVLGNTPVCSGSAAITVTVVPQFTMNVVPPLPAMCLGDSLKLSIVNISSLAVGPVSAFTYSWTEAANAPPISLTSKFTSTVSVFPQNSTTYSTEVRDSRGCVSLDKLVTVTVLPRPLTAIAIPTINNVPTNTLCYVGLNPGPVDVILTLSGSNKNTNLPFGVVPTYTWQSPYNLPYNSILTPPNNPAVVVSAPLRLPSIVTYTLLSGYNGVLGCRVADTVSVRVIDCRPVTTVSFITAEKVDTICARSCITFINLTDTMAGGTQTLTWDFKGGSPATSNASIQTVCYNIPGKYPVILTVANPYPKNPLNGVPGSTNNAGVNNMVKVVEIPNVTIVAPGQLLSDTTIRFGTAIELTGTGASNYNWSPNYNISSLTNPKVTVNPFKNTQYILTGKNSSSCSSSDTINVFVIEDCGEMFVPNAFTPNDDGVNDVLYVRGICLQNISFMIFNRWGERIFSTTDQKNGWDGTYKGEPLNSGVYVFRLEGKTYDGKEFITKGNITLIR